MHLSLQNILSLRTQDGQVVSVTAHHLSLIFDPRCDIALIEYFTLGNNSVYQFDGRLVQHDHINVHTPQDTP